MKDEYAERRAVRSVCVSNIPHDMHEEKMKEIFSSVGPVSSFRIIYDDTKRSRGYGYCEYLDKETAITAIMNFSGYELNGRTLIVESANNEKSIREIQAIIDEDAPETISKAVASLPPDQMFELMRQIKQCIENNAEEARAMLINNPPLTYALLEAQLVMGIVDLQETWALIQAAPAHKQDAVEAHLPPASALRNAVTALNEAREAAENLNSETRNPATDTNRHSLIDAFVVDQNSRDSRTMDSTATDQHPRLPVDSHIIDYNSDSHSMDDVITDSHPLLEARSKDSHPLVGDPQNIDIHSADSRTPDQHPLAHIVDSRSGSTLIAEHFGTDSHSKDSFPITTRSQIIEPQHVDPRTVDAQSLDRRTADPRVADRRALDPRIVDRPTVDPRVADRPTVDPRVADRSTVDPRVADRPIIDPRIPDRPTADLRVADRPSIDPRIPDRPSIDARIPDRPSIDPRVADRHNIDPRVMETSSQEARTGDPRSLDPRPMDPRALYSRSIDARVDPRHGERRMDPRIGDWRFMESHGADPNSMDSDTAEPHFDPRPGNPQFDNRSVDLRAVQAHPPDPRSHNVRSVGPRVMDPRAVSSRPPDPYFTDPRDPRSREALEMGPSMLDSRAQDPRMSHMGPDFRASDANRVFGGELHTRDPRLARAGPHPAQPTHPHPTQPPHHLKERPATTTPGFPRSTVSPRPVLAPTGVSHGDPGNAGAAAPSTSDEEKAALIMQVLQLSDEQIAGLSPEQQQSILVLKEQIAKSTLH